MARRKRVDDGAEAKEMAEWGVPNWKNPKEYPTARVWKNIDPDFKRWEFLRRDKKYRADWRRSEEPKPQPIPRDKRPPFSSPYGEWESPKKLAAKYFLKEMVDPRKNWKQFTGKLFNRPASYGGSIVAPVTPVPFTEAYEKWKEKTKKINKLKKLRANMDRNDFFKHVKSTQQLDLFLEMESREMAKMPPPDDWYHQLVWVEFDLSRSLDFQIEKATENLLAAQRDIKNMMKELESEKDMPLEIAYLPMDVGVKNKRGPNLRDQIKENAAYEISLLRIYDAHNTGRNYKEISDCLCFEEGAVEGSMGRSTVEKRHKRALTLYKVM